MNSAYEWYDMRNVNFLSKHDNMHNNDMNSGLKSSKNSELNMWKCIFSLFQSLEPHQQSIPNSI